MSTRVKKYFEFATAVYFENQYLINLYKVVTYMDVVTESMYEQSIAIERVKFFFENLLSDAIFINESNNDVIQGFHNLGLKICTLPEEPYDQIVGISLLSKINAITENRFICTDIELASKLSDDVGFLFNIDEEFGPFDVKGKWWHNPSLKISDFKFTSKDKIVKLSKQIKDWESINLGWIKSKKQQESESAEINFSLTTKK